MAPAGAGGAAGIEIAVEQERRQTYASGPNGLRTSEQRIGFYRT